MNTCSYCSEPLEPPSNADRTKYLHPRADWTIAGYTNSKGCEHFREEPIEPGKPFSGEWWANRQDLIQAIIEADPQVA